MKRFLTIAATLSIASLSFAASPHWAYEGDEGPDNWAQLTPEYGSCAGSNQSPVDLRSFVDARLPPIGFGYTGAAKEILNNGHTVQLNYQPGSTIELDGREFELKQLHFHAPSENRIHGKSYPLEAHLVHADAEGKLAVIAVMFEEGAANGLLSSAWKAMPEHAGESHALAEPLKVDAILPRDRDYYRFSGSLTTPPCTEGVRWLVLKQPMSASARQIERLAHVMHHPNNRPLQPLNARVVLR